MNKKILVSSLIAAFMVCSTSAFAQDRHDRNDNRPQQHDQRGDNHDDRRDDHARPNNGNLTTRVPATAASARATICTRATVCRPNTATGNMSSTTGAPAA